MEIFLQFIATVGAFVPDWLPLILVPALLLAAALFFTLLGGRRFYSRIAVFLGGIGFFLVVCSDEVKTAFIWLGLYVAFASLLRVLFLLPCARTCIKRSKKASGREEKIYRRFRESLSEQVSPLSEELPPEPPAVQARVCVTAEEGGMRLGHVTELIAKLKKEELSAADRLEVDVLSRTVDALRNKPLTEEELCTLNDCLASVLKFTAKYKL